MTQSIDNAEKKKISTIFTDIDGTLADFGNISNKNIEAIISFLELNKNNKFILISGRPKHSEKNILLNHGLYENYKDQIGLISSGGVYGSFNNELLWYEPLSFGRSKKLLDKIIENKSKGVINAIGGTYSFFDDEKSNFYEVFLKSNVIRTYPDYIRIESGDFIKSTMGSFESLISRYFNIYHFVPNEPIWGNEEWVHFSLKGLDKGVSVNKFCSYFGISKDEVLIIGDNYNDVKMLELPEETTVVMGNAPESMLKSDKINYLTRSIEEDGFAYALEKIIFGM